MALIALLAATLTAQPPRLVLGKDAGAELEVQAPAGARVALSSSVGTVGAPRRDGDAVRARYTPPALHSPSVALVLAQIELEGRRELQWLAIPLAGSDTMEIETRPGASVQATVAGSTLGPVKADRKGMVRLPMVVPPGVKSATLQITDKLGNVSERPLDLDPPPFSRLRLASRQASASAATAAEVEIFVVKPDGSPDEEADVELISAAGGDVEMRGRIGPGVYLAEYTPPEARTGTVELTARAGGQLATLELGVRPVAPGETRSFWRTSARGGTLALGMLLGAGSTFDGAAAGTALLEGALRLGALPLEATLDLGGSLFGTVDQHAAIPALAEKAKAHAWMIQAGLRASRPLLGALDGHAAISLGLQDQVVRRTFPANLGAAEESEWAPRLALAAGVGTRIGAGRALAQVQFEGAPHEVARYAGSTTGLSFMAGYLLTVR
ncbi:MAG TPA: hypothetical protein VFL36_05085 [Myxococcales bacterium]|nr:hypothetical protein [Myxococcales bacterium]